MTWSCCFINESWTSLLNVLITRHQQLNPVSLFIARLSSRQGRSEFSDVESLRGGPGAGRIRAVVPGAAHTKPGVYQLSSEPTSYTHPQLCFSCVQQLRLCCCWYLRPCSLGKNIHTLDRLMWLLRLKGDTHLNSFWISAHCFLAFSINISD